jgi:hypothetical protein
VGAFGNAVVVGETPHAGDLLTPRGESLGKGEQRREPRLQIPWPAPGRNLPAQLLEINTFGSFRRFQTRLKGNAEGNSSGILAWLIFHADLAFNPWR